MIRILVAPGVKLSVQVGACILPVIGEGHGAPFIEGYGRFPHGDILAVATPRRRPAKGGYMPGYRVVPARNTDIEEQAVLPVAGRFIPDAGNCLATADVLLSPFDPRHNRYLGIAFRAVQLTAQRLRDTVVQGTGQIEGGRSENAVLRKGGRAIVRDQRKVGRRGAPQVERGGSLEIPERDTVGNRGGTGAHGR
jgi:hypothetical protein